MKLFYADCETTGLDYVDNDLIQLAYIIEIDGRVREERNLLMFPLNPDNITEKSLEIIGKTREEILSYPPPHEAYDFFISTLEKYVNRYDRDDKFIWVGQNARFDMDFVREFFHINDDTYFGAWFESQPTDLISIARALQMKGYVSPDNYKLETLAGLFDINFNAHDALDDVRVTREVVNKLLDFIPEKEEEENIEKIKSELPDDFVIK